VHLQLLPQLLRPAPLLLRALPQRVAGRQRRAELLLLAGEVLCARRGRRVEEERRGGEEEEGRRRRGGAPLSPSSVRCASSVRESTMCFCSVVQRRSCA